MKIIVAGSRDFNNKDLLYSVLDNFQEYHYIDEIVSGTAKGADSLGEEYANNYNLFLKQFPADWSKYGKRAGHIRNEEMAKYADFLILFWDGESRGSKSMLDLAKKYKLETKVILYNKLS